ncbi:glycosyltransferase family 4 protein [Variovorax sp. J31P179]|uniref:glycosyltransferase family 4 protein n=1 Tax=Variovorax sp. J31P179 TaxID=3053508 RepID=UPI00257870D4|nr:glycosyltransferase family 4 protein [Variovorax sp. J31P179]MDM0081333.1 glycosyltransferase family 4 protein [Variovorax sp. J31P179]
MKHPGNEPSTAANRTLRILLVTRNLPPLIGGMERLNWHVSQELSRYGQVRVIGPKGSASIAPDGVKIDEVGSTKMGRFLLQAFVRGIQIARGWRPDVILAGSGLTAPIAVIAAKLSGARSAVYTHGLDLAIDHAVYRRLWLPLIARADMVIVNSSATRMLALAAGVREHRIKVIHPGVELPGDSCRHSAEHEADFRHQHGLGQGKLLISVGRLTRRKGILEFVRDVLPGIVASFPQCILVVIGDAPVHALAAAGQSIESIQAEALNAGVGANVRFVGTISDRQELASAYRSADLHVFPVLELPNDPEGFGMVAIEAAAHGLATVAYRTGGVPDAVSENRSGRLIEPGDSSGFASAAIALLERPLDGDSMAAFAQRFSWDRVGKQLAEALGAGAPE